MKAMLHLKQKLYLLIVALTLGLISTNTLKAQTYCTPYPLGGNNYIVSASTTGGVMNFTRTSGSENYVNISATHQVSQVQGLAVTINVSTCGMSGTWCSESYLKMWIDWNQDGDFTDAGEEVYATYAGAYTFSATVTVPFTATPGLTRLRIYSDWVFGPTYGYTEIAPCASTDWGEVEDYGFIVISSIACTDPSYTINAGTLSNIEICPAKPFSLTPTGASLASGLEYQWQSRIGAGAWANIVGATTLSFSSTGISTETQYRLIIKCTASGASDTTNAATVSILPFFNCYCIPSASYPTVNYITNVKTTGAILNIDNNSTTGSLTSPGYSDYTATHTISAVQATSFNFSVTETGSWGNCKIWIDYNQNGSFADPGELVFSHTTGGTYDFSGTITVPLTATPGATRMRVRTNWEWSGDITECTNLDYGEAEDYTFIVIESTPCTSSSIVFPETAEAIAEPGMVCGSGKSNLNVTTVMPIASGITYQWQSAPSATGPWTNISADLITPAFEVPLITANTYFRCLIKCAGTTVLTTTNTFVESVVPVAPVLNPAQTCGPGPVQLTGTVGSGTIFWYDAPTGGTMIGSGDTVYSPEISTTTTFYAAGGAYAGGLIQVGSGTSTSSVYNAGPYNIYYRRSTMQFMYKKDQILAAGGSAGIIEDIRLKLNSIPFYAMPDYTMSYKVVPSTMTTLTWQADGFTTFFGGTGFSYLPTATGWQTYPIAGGLSWDGNSHIIIQVCWNAVPSWSSTGAHEYTTTTGQFLWYRDDSGGSACGMTGYNSSTELPNVIFNFAGCATERYPVVAYVRDTPIINIPVLDGEYCVFNNEFSLPSTPEQPSVNTYLWNDGSTDSFMVTGPTYGELKTFWVAVTNEYGCTTSDSVKLILNPSPAVDLGNDTLVCNGGVVTVDAGPGGTSYYWNSGETTQTIEIDDAGEYYVLVGNDYGCIGTDTINVEVSEDYMPNVAGIIVENLTPNTFKFTPHHPTYVVRYEWDFGDGTPIVMSTSPTHEYSSPGTYLVTLKVYSTCGTTSHTTYATIYTSNNDVEVNSKNLNIYPNPTNDILNIETLGGVKMTNITVVNVLGQELMNRNIQNIDKHQINVGQYPSGSYYIKIETDKGTIIKKFQITK